MSVNKTVLKLGSTGTQVKELQTLLNLQASTQAKLTVDGDFGKKTDTAVRAFQQQAHLLVDGIVGNKTWSALIQSQQSQYRYPPALQGLAADIAVHYLGVTEAGNNKMGSDPRMEEIFESDKYAPGGSTDGYPWCCAFVSMCVQKLIDVSPYYRHVGKPYTPSVYLFRTAWAVEQHCKIFSPDDTELRPNKGDIVVFTFSHIGIVEKVTTDSSIHTIEGNTNAQGSREGTVVMRKVRALPIIRCFIRLPVAKSAIMSFTTEELLGLAG
ncbi:MAG: peptidoglycan-binding protein [Cellvibrionaceae bacterium]|nr:peptidoglycan-binding protein [Cellvibrionaceae bacterium]